MQLSLAARAGGGDDYFRVVGCWWQGHNYSQCFGRLSFTPRFDLPCFFFGGAAYDDDVTSCQSHVRSCTEVDDDAGGGCGCGGGAGDRRRAKNQVTLRSAIGGTDSKKAVATSFEIRRALRRDIFGSNTDVAGVVVVARERAARSPRGAFELLSGYGRGRSAPRFKRDHLQN